MSDKTEIQKQDEFWEKDQRGFLDKIQEKIVSRKFLVWLTATVAMFLGNISGDTWSGISLAFIGIVGLVEFASMWKHGRRM